MIKTFASNLAADLSETADGINTCQSHFRRVIFKHQQQYAGYNRRCICWFGDFGFCLRVWLDDSCGCCFCLASQDPSDLNELLLKHRLLLHHLDYSLWRHALVDLSQQVRAKDSHVLVHCSNFQTKYAHEFVSGFFLWSGICWFRKTTEIIASFHHQLVDQFLYFLVLIELWNRLRAWFCTFILCWLILLSLLAGAFLLFMTSWVCAFFKQVHRLCETRLPNIVFGCANAVKVFFILQV